MAAVTINCRSCGTQVPATLLVCTGCARDPRADPVAPPGSTGPLMTNAELGNPRPPASPGSIAIVLPDFERVIVPSGGRQLLGRESGNPTVDRALSGFPDVSRIHALIRNDRDGIVLEARSENRGITVEGQAVEHHDGSKTRLQVGDRVRLASLCTVKIEAA